MIFANFGEPKWRPATSRSSLWEFSPPRFTRILRGAKEELLTRLERRKYTLAGLQSAAADYKKKTELMPYEANVIALRLYYIAEAAKALRADLPKMDLAGLRAVTAAIHEIQLGSSA